MIHMVPNMFTVLSLCAGLTAIRYGLDQRFELAVALILVAAIFDGLDGRSARLLKISSRLGAELDSLADLLSFGIAPALLVYLWSLHQVEAIGWALVLLFTTCCALRLARFNTELDDPDRPAWMSRFFSGIPAPAAAGCAIIPMMMSFALGQEWPRAWALNAAVVTFVALMMVSRVPTYSIKTVIVRVEPQWVLPTLILVGLSVAALSSAPWPTLLAVGVVYVASLPVSAVMAWRLKHRHEKQQRAPFDQQPQGPAASGDFFVTSAGRGRPGASNDHSVRADADVRPKRAV